MRELRCIPAAAESLNQQYAGLEASLRNFDVVALILQKGGFPGNHLEIGVDSTFVTRIEEIERLLRRGSRIVLLARFNLEVMQRVQVVLNLLECSKRGLAIIGDGAIVLRDGNVGNRLTAAVIEESLRHGGPNGEEAAGPGEPVERGGARKAGYCRKRQRGIVSRLSNADLLIGRGHAALG